MFQCTSFIEHNTKKKYDHDCYQTTTEYADNYLASRTHERLLRTRDQSHDRW